MKKYCYWSVAVGAKRSLMQRCVNTARRAGVFKEFHVLTDAPLEGAESYEAHELDEDHGLFQLIYLKAAVSKLCCDYLVWVDPANVFTSNPINLLGALSRSPLHVPLIAHLSQLGGGEIFPGLGVKEYCDLMTRLGIRTGIYSNHSAFWIVHHDAIGITCDLALNAWHRAKELGHRLGVSFALGYAMHMLCADPDVHLIDKRPDLWASDDLGVFEECLPDGTPWMFGCPLSEQRRLINPAMVYLGKHPPSPI